MGDSLSYLDNLLSSIIVSAPNFARLFCYFKKCTKITSFARFRQKVIIA